MPRPLDRPRLFSLAWRMWRKLRRGEKAVDPELEFVRAPEIRLVGKHRIYVAMDGEVSRLAGPLHFEYKVDALNVLSLIVPDDS
jgi:diacylglycerol kinase family enzyme